MFTGLDPHGHTVVRNGYPVPAVLETLAERLSEEGWHTVAAVGGAPLEAAMGLDQGFAVYDDALPSLDGLAYQDRADGVVSRALSHVHGRPPDKPLFLFVHLFDPHAPYAPEGANPWLPDGYAGPYVDPYASQVDLVAAIEAGTEDADDLAAVVGRYVAEVHAADAAVGRLLSGLEGAGLMDETLVVVTADHGEVLGEHPLYALSHGSDVTDGALRVPLLVAGRGLPVARGAVVRSQVGLVGLAGTLEALVGLEPRLGEPRQRFERLVRAGPYVDEDGWPERPTRPLFLEATRPRARERVDGWNNLDFHRGVVMGDSVVRAAPVFGEPPAVESGPLGLGALLAALVARWDGQAPDHREEPPLAPAMERALRALGYLD